jgi:ComF family protein
MCSRCGDPVDGRVYHSYRCSWCTSGRIHFERARSALVYNGTAKRAIQQFKYNAFLSLADDFCEYLNACVKTHYSDVVIDAVVPVPLHGKRQRERSFNQSEVLGRRLAQRLRTPFHGGCLIRCKYTGSQTELNARQRRANVKGAFRVRRKERVQERSILLVDDVMTTGATTNECARVLKGAGAVEVNVVTVGRG